MSNILSLKREIERLKNLVLDRPVGCVCRYIEIVEGATLTEEQERVLESNRDCYERNHDQRAHVGFTAVIIAPIQRTGDDNSDNTPLVV
jgi:hypothetical protein